MAHASLCQRDDRRPQSEVLEEAFRLFDKDGDGNITASELQSVMNSLGQPVDLLQASEMIMSVDKDGNGLIDLDEFSEMMRGRLSTLSLSSDADQLCNDFRSLFAAFDKDNNGYIDADELRQTMSAVGLQLSDGDVAVMMNAAGVPSRGRIYYEDFLKMITHQTEQFARGHVDSSTSLSNNSQDDLRELCEAFSLFDKDGDGQITVDEVAQTMCSLGLDVRLSDVETMVDQVDTDGNGSISFDEFAQLMRCYGRHRLTRSCDSLVGDALLSETFQAFDKDHDGYLNAEDLRNTMRQLGLWLSECDVQAMMKSVGVGPQGKITFHDFCKIFSFAGSLSTNKDSAGAPVHRKSTQRQPERTDELKVVFALFDKDGDGFVTVSEVTDVLLSMRISPSPDLIREIFQQVDLDGNGEIDFDEFVLLVERCSKPASNDQEIRDMFNAIDKDRSGFVDADELKETFVALGIPLSDQDVRGMMTEAGVKDSHIYYEDFVRIIATKLDGFDKEKTTSQMSLSNGGSSVTLQHSVPSDEILRLQELHVQFAQFDKDGDGRITRQEFTGVMTSLGYTVDADEVDSMLRAADTDKNGTIDFGEFCSVMRRHWETVAAADARQAFKVFDKNSDGYIDEQELQQTMKELGVTLTSDDVTAMFTEAGCRDQRRITYQEFLTMVTGAAQTHDSSCSADAGAVGRRHRRRVSEPLCGLASSQVLGSSLPSSSENAESMQMKQIRRLVSTDNRSATRTDVGPTRSQPPPDTWQAFRVFDRNSDGYISKSELYHTLKELGVNLSLEELNSKMREADANQDGRIDYAEFCQLMRGAFENYARRAALLHKRKSVTETSVEQTVVDRSKMRQNLEQAFNGVDSNGDGRIDAQQLLEVARVVGIKVRSVPHAQALITKYGSRGDGSVCFKEFRLIQSQCEAGRQRALSQPSRDAEQRLRTAFKVFDIDGNGFIDASELRCTLADLGSCLSLPDAEALLRSADKNGDGQIDYEEFILMMYP